jgi:hypothetical protein
MLARINTWIKMPERIYGCIRRCTVKQANWGSYFPWEITCKNWALHLSVGICGMLLVHQRGPQSRCNAEAAYLQAQTRPALFLISSQARWSPRFFSHGSHLLTLALGVDGNLWIWRANTMMFVSCSSSFQPLQDFTSSCSNFCAGVYLFTYPCEPGSLKLQVLKME